MPAQRGFGLGLADAVARIPGCGARRARGSCLADRGRIGERADPRDDARRLRRRLAPVHALGGEAAPARLCGQLRPPGLPATRLGRLPLPGRGAVVRARRDRRRRELARRRARRRRRLQRRSRALSRRHGPGDPCGSCPRREAGRLGDAARLLAGLRGDERRDPQRGEEVPAGGGGGLGLLERRQAVVPIRRAPSHRCRRDRPRPVPAPISRPGGGRDPRGTTASS